MAFVIIYTIVFVTLLFVGCRDLVANWFRYDLVWLAENAEKAHCWNQSLAFTFATLCGAFSVFTDWYSIMLPAVLLLRLRINARQKYGLWFIFGIGYLYAPPYPDSVTC